MYIVLKGFASEKISASKGKVIKIEDKKIVASLLKAGLIAPYVNKNKSDEEKDFEIQKLKEQLVMKDDEIKTLNEQKEVLKQEKENPIQECNKEIKDEEDNFSNEKK